MPRLGFLPDLTTPKQTGCFSIPETHKQTKTSANSGATQRVTTWSLVSVSALSEGGLSICSSFCQHTQSGHPCAGPRRLSVPPGHPGNCRAGAGWPPARTTPPGPAPDQPQHARRTCLHSLPGRRRLAPPHALTRAGRRRHTPRAPVHADLGHPAPPRPQA